jgi:hypothetical protein
MRMLGNECATDNSTTNNGSIENPCWRTECKTDGSTADDRFARLCNV